MLSSGTRIGLYRVNNWINEGSCGQSYEVEGNSGRTLGKRMPNYFIGLFRNRWVFRFFSQECLAIQQLQERGIWPLLSYGVTKWKHWLIYWFKGPKWRALPKMKILHPKVYVRSLDDLAEYCPHHITPKVQKYFDRFHCGLPYP